MACLLISSRRPSFVQLGAAVLLGRALPVRRRVLRVVLATLAALTVPAVWYVLAQLQIVEWPRASSWFGTLLGYVGGVIIFFEMLLWSRKRQRGRRWRLVFPSWSTKQWLWFHIVCGWLVLPVIVVHSGFAFGGWLSMATMWLFLAVIASGVYGLILQQWLPQKLYAEIPDETVAAGVNQAVLLHIDEARLIIERLIPFADADSPMWGEPVVTATPAIRLRTFVEDTLTPYLRDGSLVVTDQGTLASPLTSQAESAVLFNRLRSELPEAAHRDLDRLEQIANLRRQWDRQRSINWWLHSWLVIHAPLSLMMVIFMIFHAVKALKFW